MARAPGAWLLEVEAHCIDRSVTVTQVLLHVESGHGEHAVAQIVDDHAVAVAVKIVGDAEHAHGYLVELHVADRAPHRTREHGSVPKVVAGWGMYEDDIVGWHRGHMIPRGREGRGLRPSPFATTGPLGPDWAERPRKPLVCLLDEAGELVRQCVGSGTTRRV
jgi:hypothetical protein